MPYASCLTGEAEEARVTSARAEGRVRGAQTDLQTGPQTDAEDVALEEEHAGVAGVAGSCRSCCSFWCPLWRRDLRLY
jgi:hypothetical protein